MPLGHTVNAQVGGEAEVSDCTYGKRGAKLGGGRQVQLLSKVQVELSLSSATNSSVHSLIQQTQSTCCVPGSLPKAGDTAVNQGDRSPDLSGAFNSDREDNKSMWGL